MKIHFNENQENLELAYFIETVKECSNSDAVEELSAKLLYTWRLDLPCGKLRRCVMLPGRSANYKKIIRNEVEKFDKNWRG
jgi:hypothetical protein